MKDITKLNSKNQDPLHGITLEMVLNRLVDFYGWEKLGRQINIDCSNNNPSIKSSLKFLRKTPWAREKVNGFYLYYGNPPWRNKDFDKGTIE